MKLAIYNAANYEFFQLEHAPSQSIWVDWISRGVVQGKVIDGIPWVDLNWFAVTQVMEEQVKTPRAGIDLLL